MRCRWWSRSARVRTCSALSEKLYAHLASKCRTTRVDPDVKRSQLCTAARAYHSGTLCPTGDESSRRTADALAAHSPGASVEAEADEAAQLGIRGCRAQQAGVLHGAARPDVSDIDGRREAEATAGERERGAKTCARIVDLCMMYGGDGRIGRAAAGEAGRGAAGALGLGRGRRTARRAAPRRWGGRSGRRLGCQLRQRVAQRAADREIVRTRLEVDT